jgi:acyl carrier protein
MSEDDIRKALQSVLSACCPDVQLASDVSLVAQGMGSLAATRFCLKVQARFNMSIPVAELATGLTLAQVVARIDRDGGSRPGQGHLAP